MPTAATTAATTAPTTPTAALIPNLRSPYAKVGRLAYFGRMLDKIRLHAAGKLPADYLPNLGDANPNHHDGRCCAFLGVKYSALVAKVLATAPATAPAAASAAPTPADDEALLAWAHAAGTPRTDADCRVWNHYMCKLGWRDESHARLLKRIAEGGDALKNLSIETFFDLLDADEGRDPAVERRQWENS